MIYYIPKPVLLVDDDEGVIETLVEAFDRFSKDRGCPYVFDVDVAETRQECVKKIRAKRGGYDIITLDIKLGSNLRAGLDMNLALALAAEFGMQRPVRVIYTGEAKENKDIIDAVRKGAWDYMIKPGNPDLLISSAIDRLRQLDLRREQEEKIVERWLPANYYWLENVQSYAGKLLALWHKPDELNSGSEMIVIQDGVAIIADGFDAFDLEDKTALKDWRIQHQTWEQPFLLQIPPVPENS